jgi:hypothetical protein
MDQHIDTLIQQELDGLNTEEDSLAAREAMQSDSDVQARFDEYRLLTQALENLPQSDPSADFTRTVMSALPRASRVRASQAVAERGVSERAASRRAASERTTFSLSDFLFGPRLRLAYAFVAGALITTAVILSGGREVGGGAATMAPPFETIEVAGVSVHASESGESLILEFQGESELSFRFDPAAYDVSAVSWSEAGVFVTSEPGHLAVSNGGAASVRVEMSPAYGPPIEISSGDGTAGIIKPRANQPR